MCQFHVPSIDLLNFVKKEKKDLNVYFHPKSQIYLFNKFFVI
jgi:hypothetical protein